jgi:hypothetical protein
LNPLPPLVPCVCVCGSWWVGCVGNAQPPRQRWDWDCGPFGRNPDLVPDPNRLGGHCEA